MFELSQLRCFVAVAEELHFGRAATRLHMSQPPLSRQIQLLEHAVGALLLERSSRSVRLTAAGQVFLRDAASILRQAEHAAFNAARIASGKAGRVVIGHTAVSGYGLIPGLLHAASQAMPDINIVLMEMVSTQQMQAMAENVIDLAFARPIAGGESLQWHRVWREPMQLALPSAHPLATRRRVKLEDLRGHPLIMYSANEGRYFHDKINALFAATGVQPDFVHHIGQTHTIMALVGANMGLAIVPASAQQLRFEHVVFKPLWRNDVFAEVHLAWRPDHHNPAQDAVRRFSIKYLARHQQAGFGGGAEDLPGDGGVIAGTAP